MQSGGNYYPSSSQRIRSQCQYPVSIECSVSWSHNKPLNKTVRQSDKYGKTNSTSQCVSSILSCVVFLLCPSVQGSSSSYFHGSPDWTENLRSTDFGNKNSQSFLFYYCSFRSSGVVLHNGSLYRLFVLLFKEWLEEDTLGWPP